MIILNKQGKVFYKVVEQLNENNEVEKQLVGGVLVATPNEATARDFIEFDNVEQAERYFGIKVDN